VCYNHQYSNGLWTDDGFDVWQKKFFSTPEHLEQV
jgi:hypothetical protein